MKIPLNGKPVAEIERLGAVYREARALGNNTEAESCLLKAWEMIPEPKFDYDFYPQSLARGIVGFYRDIGEHQKAIKWLDIARTAYGPEPNPSIEYLAGTVFYKAGDLEQAFLTFEALVRNYKFRPFQGDDPEYLRFYKSEASRRKR